MRNAQAIVVRTRTPARSTSARLHVISHPKRHALVMLIAAALVAGMGARFTASRAAADTGDQTFESGGYSITLTQNGTITILDKKTSTALEGTPDPSAEPISEDQIRTQADSLITQLEKDLGWNLALENDHIQLIHEVNTLHQKLDSIPQTTLNLRENADVRTLRDIIDQTYANNQCRERCLDISPAFVLIAGGALAYNIRSIRDKMYQGVDMGIALATGGILLLALNAAAFWKFLSTTLDDPRLPESMKRVLLLLTGAIFSGVARTMADLIQYTSQSRKTVREDVTAAAERVHSLTPDTEPANDYDLVKEEL
jgi:hypothetical protein